MLKKLWAFAMRHYGLFAYLFFGGLTTAIDFVVFWLCHNVVGLAATISNVFAWILAVAFAYLTNKPFVFKSYDWSKEVVLPELSRFVVCRLGSFLLQTAILFAVTDCIGWDGMWVKVITGGLIMVINYVGSKLLVFRNRQ